MGGLTWATASVTLLIASVATGLGGFLAIFATGGEALAAKTPEPKSGLLHFVKSLAIAVGVAFAMLGACVVVSVIADR